MVVQRQDVVRRCAASATAADEMCVHATDTDCAFTAENGVVREIAFLIRLLRLVVNSCGSAECSRFDKGFLVKFNTERKTFGGFTIVRIKQTKKQCKALKD